MYIPQYVDLNPLDLKFPLWKKGGGVNGKKAVRFLKEYRWSSFRDYMGESNFPDVINRSLYFELFGTDERSYEDDLESWIDEGNPMSTWHVDMG